MSGFTNLKVLTGLIVLCLWGCSNNSEPEEPADSFDREAMITNWADNIIIPAYEAYLNDVNSLKTAKDAFAQSVDQSNLDQLRDSWLVAYTSWQKVSMFEIGKAESLALRDFTNIFPTNPSSIESNISNGNYNLELPSTRDHQGFPAIDYLLHGVAGSDIEILAVFTNDAEYVNYLSALVDRIQNLTAQVVDDWNSGYREEFIMNSGSDAASSVNKLANDYLFYYEKALRAGKIGIPAGVFSTNPLSDKVEALFVNEVSKQLFDVALQTTIDFFNGVHYGSSAKGASFSSYLDYLSAISDGENLSLLINNQFTAAQNEAANLQNSFQKQVDEDNEKMLKTYDELQANVVLLKVDMFQALNISVDYVDADGD